MVELLGTAILGVGGFCGYQLWQMNARLASLCQQVRDHHRRLVVLEGGVS